MQYPIDKDVPIPKKTKGSGRRTVYPLDKMELGDSFVVPLEQRKDLSVRIRYQAKKTGRAFTTRKISDTSVRVWRTK